MNLSDPEPGAAAKPKTASERTETLADQTRTPAGAPPAPHLLPTFTDHELLVPIGKGSYGEVWLARNVMRTYRAVKIVYRDSFERARPFEREFNGIKKFEPISRSHDGLVDVLQVGRTESYFYYVMELADDVATGQEIDPAHYTPKTLRSEVTERGHLPFERCLEVALALTQGLSHMHKHGLIHRDIKPSNIIFVHGITKLADIGLVAEQSEAKSFVGTEGFIPPEGPGTPQADIYSLGKVLYEIATGKDRQEFPALPTLLGETKEDDHLLELNSVFLKACQSDIKLRYQTCEQMRDDLMLLQSGKSVKRSHAVERRLAILTRLSAAGVTLTLLILAGLFYTREQTKRETQLRTHAEQERQRAERGELAARQHLYAANMNLARQAYQSGDYGRTLELLNLHRPGVGEPDPRHWEWRHLWSLCRGDQLTTLRTSGYEVLALKYLSEDRLLTGDIYGAIEIWDLPTRRVVTRLDARALADLASSADNQVIAMAHWTRFVSLRKGGLQSSAYVLSHSGPVSNLELSPDGSVLAAAGEHGLTLWDIESRQIKHRLLTFGSGITDLGFSSDGRLLAYWSRDRQVALWDVTTGQQIETLPIPGGSEHKFSPDGRLLAVGYRNGAIRLVNLQTKEVKSMTNHTDWVRAIAFSPDGNFMVSTAHSPEVCIWSTADGKALSVLKGPEKLISSVAFSPSGRFFATGSKDATIRIWSTNSVGQARIETVRLLRQQSAISDDGTHLATLDTNAEVKILELGTMQEKGRIPLDAGGQLLALSNEGQWVASRDRHGKVLLWDVRRLVDPNPLDAPLEAVQLASFSPDRTRLAVLESNSVLSAYVLPEGRRTAALNLTLDQQRTSPRLLVHSPDGRLIATADLNGLLNVVDASTWRIRGTFSTHVGDCRSVAIGPDGSTIALSGEDETVRIWTLAPWKPVKVLTGGSGGYYCIGFSPDGKRLAAGASQILRVWELEQFQPVASIQWPRETISNLRFAPGGDALIAAGRSGLARVFRAPSLANIEAAEPRSSRPSAADAANENTPPSHTGAIAEWLILDLMPVAGTEDAALDEEQIEGEARLQPKEKEGVQKQGARFVWRRFTTATGVIELSGDSTKTEARARAAYAVCYLVAAREIRECVIEAGSSEEYKMYLNGAPVIEYAWRRIGREAPRSYPAIKDRIPEVKLVAGVNVVVLKMISEGGRWSGSVKICDEGGNPLPDVRLTTTP